MTDLVEPTLVDIVSVVFAGRSPGMHQATLMQGYLERCIDEGTFFNSNAVGLMGEFSDLWLLQRDDPYIGDIVKRIGTNRSYVLRADALPSVPEEKILATANAFTSRYPETRYVLYNRQVAKELTEPQED